MKLLEELIKELESEISWRQKDIDRLKSAVHALANSDPVSEYDVEDVEYDPPEQDPPREYDPDNIPNVNDDIEDAVVLNNPHGMSRSHEWHKMPPVTEYDPVDFDPEEASPSQRRDAILHVLKLGPAPSSVIASVLKLDNKTVWNDAYVLKRKGQIITTDDGDYMLNPHHLQTVD
jgi:hypothetical protein